MTDVEFEELIKAWLPLIGARYEKVIRLGGPGDLGRDICGLESDDGFRGAWDNIQCKHYKDPLRPRDVRADIGKILWHTWRDEYICPRTVKFCGSHGIGTKLAHLFEDAKKLKDDIIANWENGCRDAITQTCAIQLEDSFGAFVEAFNFRIFEGLDIDDVLDQLKGTPYFVQTFGGGLPPRPLLAATPTEIAPKEQKYLSKLFEVYGERTGTLITALSHLDNYVVIRKHLDRQRTSFYSAESLREFARDHTPAETFADFQDDIYAAVVESCDCDYDTSYSRLQAVLTQAANTPPAVNALYDIVDARDKQGVCHQLANDDRLNWVQR